MKVAKMWRALAVFGRVQPETDARLARGSCLVLARRTRHCV